MPSIKMSQLYFGSFCSSTETDLSDSGSEVSSSAKESTDVSSIRTTTTTSRTQSPKPQEQTTVPHRTEDETINTSVPNVEHGDKERKNESDAAKVTDDVKCGTEQHNEDDTCSVLQQTIKTLHAVKEGLASNRTKAQSEQNNVVTECDQMQVQKLQWPEKEKEKPYQKKGQTKRPDQQFYKTSDGGRQQKWQSSSSENKGHKGSKAEAKITQKRDNEFKQKSNSTKSSKDSCKNQKQDNAQPAPSATNIAKEVQSSKGKNLEPESSVTVQALDLSGSGRTGLDVYVLIIESPKLMWLSPQSPDLDDMQEYIK